MSFSFDRERAVLCDSPFARDAGDGRETTLVSECQALVTALRLTYQLDFMPGKVRVHQSTGGVRTCNFLEALLFKAVEKGVGEVKICDFRLISSHASSLMPLGTCN